SGARGLVALGDSITRGSGETMLGLRMQSWALWLAEALELPYTCLAEDGARVGDALERQAPRLRGPYEIGCIYIGVNDVRAPGFDASSYAHALDELTLSASLHARRLLMLRIPADLGRPPARAEAIAEANATIVWVASRHQALVVGLRGLRGPMLVMPDAVHLTARGEAHVALLAARALHAEGLAVREDALLEALAPLREAPRLRYLLGARAMAQLRDWRRQLRERAAPPG
ncbi:MAG: GDSL-type esterase/lipase family protein, partial [Solirubrobacteraceae bacterium]